MSRVRRAHLILISASSITTPIAALAQHDGPLVGQYHYQGLVPNNWLVDANGNLIWLSGEDLKRYELAQVITPEAVVQVAADEASKVGSISAELLKQIGWYSVGAGALVDCPRKSGPPFELGLAS